MSPTCLPIITANGRLANCAGLGEVRLNDTGKVLDAKALAQAARGCEIIVSDRQTPGPAAFFSLAPDLVAFLRVAVDIRNIDVEAASRKGILVTHATPGFIRSVAEMAIGFMVDCGRHITDATIDYRAGACRKRAWASSLPGPPQASSAMAPSANIRRRCVSRSA
ncbi:MAG: hypothetical protein WDN48_07935 [Pseudolabrys sp.]